MALCGSSVGRSQTAVVSRRVIDRSGEPDSRGLQVDEASETLQVSGV